MFQYFRDALPHEGQHAEAVGGLGEGGLGGRGRGWVVAQVPDRDLGAVHAVDDEGVVHADVPEPRRDGQPHRPEGRHLAVLKVPATPVRQVDKAGTRVRVLAFVTQHHGPAVAQLGRGRCRVEDGGGATEGGPVGEVAVPRGASAGRAHVRGPVRGAAVPPHHERSLVPLGS